MLRNAFAQDDCGVIYANAAKDYGAMQDAIAALPDVEMIHSVNAPDLGSKDAPKVCQFRRVAKDVKDDWCDIMRLFDTSNDEQFLSEVGPGFFSDLVRGPNTFECTELKKSVADSGLIVLLLQDMMEIGNPDDHANGDSFGVPGKLTNALTVDEQIAHFSLWAAFKSPLVIGVSDLTDPSYYDWRVQVLASSFSLAMVHYCGANHLCRQIRVRSVLPRVRF